MAAEFDHHMDEERASGEGRNHRNGATRKHVLAGDGTVEITVPSGLPSYFKPPQILSRTTAEHPTWR
jgi:transposase-like protein